MKRKMALLEQAHGLLCNVPSDGTSAEDGDMWRKLRAEWIERWFHVIGDHATKHHNKRIQIGNEAIEKYAGDRFNTGEAQRVAAQTMGSNWRVIKCPVHGTYALDLNGPESMCGECRVVGPDGKPLGRQDGLAEDVA